MAKKNGSNSRNGVPAWLSEDSPSLNPYLGLGHKKNFFSNENSRG